MKTDTTTLELSRKKSFCTVKTRFYLHGYLNSEGKTQIIFSVTVYGNRKKIYTGFYANPNFWDSKKQRVKNDENLNLILDNLFAKATQIQTFYFLTKRELNLESFLNEFFSQTPSYDFNSFMLNEIEKQCANPNTLKKHKSIHKKLKEYKEVIPFTEINFQFIVNYRAHLRKIGNNRTTENSNIKIIKHYLKTASKYGITLNLDLDEIKPGSCSGNRTAISQDDIKKLSGYFFSEYIKSNWRLSLGYFLFAYNTGMRISDLRNLKRSELEADYIEFRTVKTKKIQEMKLNNNAKALLRHEPRLFRDFITQQKINEQLKQIAAQVGVRKKLSLHVARHTFATSYLKAGGSVHHLQKLLGHSKIETTMIYVHLNMEDALETVHLLDKL